MAGTFVNIDKMDIELIDTVNPFQRAFEILSKNVTTSVLRAIQDTIALTKEEITEAEAIMLWPRIKEWATKTGEQPSMQSHDPKERRMALALVFLREEKRKRAQHAG